MTNQVTIVGSLNVDTTMKVKRMPLPGETIAALSKTMLLGEKVQTKLFLLHVQVLKQHLLVKLVMTLVVR